MAQSVTQLLQTSLPEYLVESVRDCVIDTLNGCGMGTTVQHISDETSGCSGVVGMIWLNGESYSWLISLSLPRETALAITTKFTGFEIEFDSPDMTDIVGELANVLAGDVIARIAIHGLMTEMSLPTAVRGDNVLVHPPGSLASKQINFRIPEGSFWVCLTAARRVARVEA
jgi:chemotaxis protein CheX